MDYRAKVAVVTGASSGIGYDLARELARRGSTVVGVARRAELLVRLVAECRAASPASSYLCGDLGERSFAEHVVNETVRVQGRLDILVNNAGVPSHKQIYDVSADEVEHLLRVNFLSCVWTTLAAIPHMLVQGGGTIVNVSSMSAKVAPPRETAYTASKCAMEGFTAGLWNDLAGSNIHAALVVPGPIDTEIWAKDETPSAYKGVKYPPRIVTGAILQAIEKRRHEIVVPKRSPQLVVARFLRFAAPALLRAGMAAMEPVPAEAVDRARSRALARRGAPPASGTSGSS
ncbi:MAG: SDR family NAD(P)-dependent oxidoreductase [Thermodesulfobacteriota bacterium]